jgi:hypothetical protein
MVLPCLKEQYAVDGHMVKTKADEIALKMGH